MAVTDKLKGMVEELRQDLIEVKEQVKQLLPAQSNSTDLQVTMPRPEDRMSRGRRISIGHGNA